MQCLERGEGGEGKNTHSKGYGMGIGKTETRVSCPLLKRQKLKMKTRKDKSPDSIMMYIAPSNLVFEVEANQRKGTERG